MRKAVSTLVVALFWSFPLTAQPPTYPPPLPPQIVVMPSTMAVVGMEEESPGNWKIELLNSSPKGIYALAFRRYSEVPGNFASNWSYPSPAIPSGETRNSYLHVNPLMPGDRRSPQRLEAERSFSISAVYEDGSCEGQPETCPFLLAEREGRRIEASIELAVLRRASEADSVSRALTVLQELPDESETRLLIEKQLGPRLNVPEQSGLTPLGVAIREASSLRYDLQRELAQIIPLIPGVQSVKVETLRSSLRNRITTCESLLAAGR